MPHYCDTAELERNWFNWLLASTTPELEDYRKSQQLWTRPIGVIIENQTPVRRNGKMLSDPLYPTRQHLIIGPTTRYIISGIDNYQYKNNTVNTFKPFTDDHLISIGFIKEQPINHSWHQMLESINIICYNVAKKFRLSEEEHQELSSEACLHVIRKISTGKLVYIPGKAPVFNLLTTTIFRCMFSIMNKKNKIKFNLNKLLQEIEAGAIVSSNRSLRYQ